MWPLHVSEPRIKETKIDFGHNKAAPPATLTPVLFLTFSKEKFLVNKYRINNIYSSNYFKGCKDNGSTIMIRSLLTLIVIHVLFAVYFIVKCVILNMTALIDLRFIEFSCMGLFKVVL